MTDSIFAKIILLFASVLTVLTGADYIKISSDSLTYDFKINDRTPIYYYLNTENIGIKKVRFDITSQSNWVSVYKEGEQAATKTSLELAQYTPLNFVLEIHPEQLPDGTNNAKVIVEAVDLQDFSILESKEINIAVNKNFKSSPAVSPEFSPSQTVSPEVTASPGASAVSTPPPTLITPTPSIKTSPSFLTSSPSPKISPALTISPAKTPSPSSISSPSPSRLNSILKEIQSLIDSIWSLLKRIF